jgi:hypothetical protein
MLLKEILAVGDCKFLHLPQAKKTESNLGYAFVDFGTPEATMKFLKDFEGHRFEKQKKSSKRATLGFAQRQGLNVNIEFYETPAVASRLSQKPWVAQN